MHSKGQGLLASLLMFVPLLAVPFVASFGVPWLSAKSKEDGLNSPQAAESSLSKPRVGYSQSGMHSAEDLFEPVSKQAVVDLRFAPPSSQATAQNPHLRNASLVISNEESWVDPFERLKSGPSQNQTPSPGNSRPSVPEDPLSGWALKEDSTASPASDAPMPQEFPESQADALEPPATANPFAEFEFNGSMPAKATETQVAVSESAFDDPRHDTRTNADPNSFDPSRPLFKQNEASQAPRKTSQPGARPQAGAPAKVSANSGNNVQESSNPLTWETARRRLEALGIKHFYVHENPASRQFHFRCSYSPPDNPRVTQLFEAEAAEPLEAVRRVLVQVETWAERQAVRPNQSGSGTLLH